MMIGVRIRQSRLASGLTLDELSEKMAAAGHPITKAALSKYELGKSVPSPAFLVILGRVLGVRPSYFQEVNPIQVDWIAFRKKSKMPLKKQEQVQAFAAQVIERQLWLQGVLYPELRPSIPKPREASSMEHAEDAAARLRKAWNLDECAIDWCRNGFARRI